MGAARCTAVALTAEATANAAQAADIRVEIPETATSPAVITVTGKIDRDEGRAFAAAVSGINHATVYFHSVGGNLYGAVDVGLIIREKGFHTAVANFERRDSGCGLARLGGTKRFLGMATALGFHSASDVSGARSDSANEFIGYYLEMLGLSRDAAAYVTEADPKSMTLLTNEKDGK